MRKLTVVLSLVLVLVLVVGVACGGGGTPTTTPTQTSTPTGTAPTQTSLPPVTIKFTYHSYLTASPLDEPIWWQLEEVERRMGGRVKFEVEKFFAQSLAKAPEVLEAVQNGVFDLTWLTPGYTPAKMPLWNVPNSIPLHTTDEGAAAEAMYVFNEWAPSRAELDQFNVVFIGANSTDPYEVLGNKRIQTLADIKGYRARTFGLSSKPWDKIGGVPVTMTFPEAFDSVQKGTIDGVLACLYQSAWPTKIQEITKYMTILGWVALPVPVLINKDKWDTIPKDIQDMILEVGLETSEWTYRMYREKLAGMYEEFRGMGGVIDYLPEADRATIQRLGGEPVWQEIRDELDGKGLPGTEAVDLVLKTVRDYEKAHPR